MNIGYARVSTHDQNLDLQLDALHQAQCERIFQDKSSGAKAARIGLDDALGFMRAGDVLIVWRLDRLARSLKHLIELVEALERQGCGLRSLQESIDTTSSSGKLVFHLFGALAEFERNLIKERTRAGLEAARARGRKGGRHKALSADQEQLAIRLYQEKEHSVPQICKLVGVSKPTLYKYLHKAGL